MSVCRQIGGPAVVKRHEIGTGATYTAAQSAVG
jgi:hypothetical protein